MTDVRHTVTLVLHECPECGVQYGLTEVYEDARREDHKTFCCPNGHWLSYKSETREQKLRRQLDATTRQLSNTQSELKATEYARRAIKGQLTRTKKRIAAGVCPCCNRSFSNLAAHMAGQHPNYGGDHA